MKSNGFILQMMETLTGHFSVMWQAPKQIDWHKMPFEHIKKIHLQQD